MKPRIRKILMVLLAITLVVGLVGMGWTALSYRQGASEYSKAQELAQLPAPAPPPKLEPLKAPNELPTEAEATEGVIVEQPKERDPYAESLLQTDLKSLSDVNPDVVGWITIPGTAISYPLLQGADNQFYLSYTWEKTWNYVGSIYLDYRTDRAFTDFNTIIYGHNMRDGSMFCDLIHFVEPGYLEEHPVVYIVQEGVCRRYRVFAAYEVDSGTAEAYFLNFDSSAKEDAYLARCLEMSAVDVGIVPTSDDQIITLSTCTNLGSASRMRWVVQAVLDLETFPEDIPQDE